VLHFGYPEDPLLGLKEATDPELQLLDIHGVPETPIAVDSVFIASPLNVQLRNPNGTGIVHGDEAFEVQPLAAVGVHRAYMVA
jgi:hypothetical protein